MPWNSNIECCQSTEHVLITVNCAYDSLLMYKRSDRILYTVNIRHTVQTHLLLHLNLAYSNDVISLISLLYLLHFKVNVDCMTCMVVERYHGNVTSQLLVLCSDGWLIRVG